MTGLYHIATIGCQMNVYDSDRMADQIESLGYRRTDSPEAADLIVMNTCAIREKAEQKVFSYLGRLAPLKRKNPGLIIAVGGCVAQQEGRRILSRVPHVDLVFGTHAIDHLSRHLHLIRARRRRLVDVALSGRVDAMTPPTPETGSGASRFVTIMQGCDNYCTYCVVPHVRGREASRHPDRIVAEIEALVASGVREVTLLGQNVNSYGKKEGLCAFPELLRKVHAIPGLLRIRFTTSHPKDLSEDLIRCFADLDRLCRHIHLPVQSGSDRVLHRMNRKYGKTDYLSRVAQLRAACPDIAITSDVIVGFPGETDTDFAESLDLIESVRFDGLFAFMYSDRPSAPAGRFPDKVPAAVKSRRLQEVLRLQERMTRGKHEALVGTEQEILVDGVSRAPDGPSGGLSPSAPQWTGRTSHNRIVHVAAADGHPPELAITIGKLIWVHIERALSHSLQGRALRVAAPESRLKGDPTHAAQSEYCGHDHGSGVQHPDHHPEDR